MQAFLKFNNGVKYLLTVIDVFSRYGWMMSLKTKTGLEVANALKIYKHRNAKNCWSVLVKSFTTSTSKNSYLYIPPKTTKNRASLKDGIAQ